MKIVLSHTQLLSITETFRRLCVLARKSGAKTKDMLKLSPEVSITAGLIQDTYVACSSAAIAPPDSNNNYTPNFQRKFIKTIDSVCALRIASLKNNIIPAYERKQAKGEAGIDAYLTKARDRVTMLERIQAACRRALG